MHDLHKNYATVTICQEVTYILVMKPAFDIRRNIWCELVIPSIRHIRQQVISESSLARQSTDSQTQPIENTPENTNYTEHKK